MAQLQKQFETFHDTIKLDNYDENAKLREKRDLLLKELREKLPAEANKFTWFNQGSYAIGTGVVPKDGNYDIDVGVVFPNVKQRMSPIELKVAVRDALSLSKRTVRIRRPCVTVEYLLAGEPQYHVDLALYSVDANQKLELAVGKEHSDPELISWDVSDPEGLKTKILGKYEGDQKKQFQRIVRYLKRWRDNKFDHGRLISIALTVAAWDWLSPCIDGLNGSPNDVRALESLLTSIMSKWKTFPKRLVVKLPVEPNKDLLEKMSDLQMEDLFQKIQELRDALVDVQKEPSLHEACKVLAKFFGDEFPIPPDDEKRDKVGKSYISTGTSA